MKKLKFKSLLIILLFTISFVGNIYSQTNDSEKKGTRTIYLIRHGHYDEADERDEYIGKGLTPLRIAQARLVASRLKGMPIEFSSLISSTMTRAKQTSQVIVNDFPEIVFEQSELIRECTPPTWREDVMAETNNTEAEECVDNLEQAFQRYFIPSPVEKDWNDIIVCHGNVIRYFVTKKLKEEKIGEE